MFACPARSAGVAPPPVGPRTPASARRRRPGSRAPSRSANRFANSAAISFDRTRPDAGLSEIARANRPSAAGTANNVAVMHAPALSPKMVTLPGSPPNSRDVVPHPLQRQHQIAQVQVAVDGDVRCRQRRQVQTAQRAEPVVDRYVHATAARQRGAVV